MPSRKNVWRRIGAIEVRRETCRLHDGTPWGDTLWFRTPKVKGQRRVAYVQDHKEGAGLSLGLGTYWPAGKRGNPVAAAHVIRAELTRAIEIA